MATESDEAAFTCAGGALGLAGRVVVQEAAADDASRFKRGAGVSLQLREAIFTSSAALRFRHYKQKNLLITSSLPKRFKLGLNVRDAARMKLKNHLWWNRNIQAEEEEEEESQMAAMLPSFEKGGLG